MLFWGLFSLEFAGCFVFGYGGFGWVVYIGLDVGLVFTSAELCRLTRVLVIIIGCDI